MALLAQLEHEVLTEECVQPPHAMGIQPGGGGPVESVSALAPSISCHSFTASGDRVALSPNSAEVHVYAKGDGGAWLRTHVLKEHDGLVSAVDWEQAGSGLLVTCAHDRNAYVWREGTGDKRGELEPSLVLLRLNRAALCARWAPSGGKFAIASGAKTVSVCHYEREHDWWESRLIKKHHASSVVSVAWHPSGILLATACTDCKARVFTAHVSGVDDADAAAAVAGNHRFGDCVLEVDAFGAWTHSIAWSPSGTTLAFPAHDSTLHLVTRLAGANVAEWQSSHIDAVIRVRGLPLVDLAFLSEDTLVAGGFDCSPLLFEKTDGESWALSRELTGAVAKESRRSSQFTAGLAMFKAQTEFGQDAEGSASTGTDAPKGPHSKAISSLRALGGTRFSTTGHDGMLVVWDIAKGAKGEGVAKLKIGE